MTITELEKLRCDGKLILDKKVYREGTKHIVVYKHKYPKSDTEWSDVPGYYDEIKEEKDVKYKRYAYSARTNDMVDGFWKITKRDYEHLLSVNSHST